MCRNNWLLFKRLEKYILYFKSRRRITLLRREGINVPSYIVLTHFCDIKCDQMFLLGFCKYEPSNVQIECI